MSAHTPTPWRMSPWHIEEGPSAVRTARDYPEDFIICTTASDDDAAFIVKAVNSHEALVKALEWYANHKNWIGDRAREALAAAGRESE